MDTTAKAEGTSLLPLLIWFSPGFPVGAFAYSHGLEWAVEAGDIVDAQSLEAWLVDLVEYGAPRSDAFLFSAAFCAAAAADWPTLIETNALAVALSSVGRTPSRDHGAGSGVRRCGACSLGL